MVKEGIKENGCLEKLLLMIKQGLQFLNSFCFSLQNKSVFLFRQGNKIINPVICFDTIKMVNNPSFGQGFVMGSFPNKNMFSNISVCWAIGFFDVNIAIFNKSIFGVKHSWIIFTTKLGCTTFTSYAFVTCWFSTVYTRMLFALIKSFKRYLSPTFPTKMFFSFTCNLIALLAKFAFTMYKCSAKGARILVALFIKSVIFFARLSHSAIITQKQETGKIDRAAIKLWLRNELGML